MILLLLAFVHSLENIERSNVSSSYEAAIEYSRQGNILDALPLFQKAAIEEPENANVFQCLSNMACIYADFEKCVKYHGR